MSKNPTLKWGIGISLLYIIFVGKIRDIMILEHNDPNWLFLLITFAFLILPSLLAYAHDKEYNHPKYYAYIKKNKGNNGQLKGTKKSLKEMNDEMKNFYKKQGLDFLKNEFGNIKYLTGFKDIGIKEDIYISLFKDRIRFNFEKDFYRDVLKNDISDCRIETETQIRNQISMGKILCLGIFAFGGNNTKEINKEYLVIDCKFKNNNINILLEFKDQISLEEASKDINRLIESEVINEEEFLPYLE
ncbi:MAG: hypothetical protein RSD06_00750 [Bacilli bacterium]